MQKKRILIFQPALAPYMIDQYNFLGDIFDMKLIFFYENVPNDSFDQKKLSSQLRYGFSLLLKGGSLGRYRIFRWGVWKAIKKYSPDIILSYEFSLTTQFLILLKRLRLIRAKIGSSNDDSLEICLNDNFWLHKLSRRYSVKHLDYLIVFSDEVAGFYHQNFHVPEKNIIVFPILQSEQRLRKETEKIEAIAQQRLKKYQLEQKRVLLYVGRFSAVKGLSKFIEIVSPFLHTDPDLVFVLVGSGEEYETIKQLVVSNQLEDQILLPGKFEGNDLYAWFLCASGLVLPSVFEPYGAVVNEALIFGLRVLCSRYAGSRVLISSANGIVFDPLNENDTRIKLNEFLMSIPKINTSFSEKKSLTEDCNNVFLKTWQKVLSE